MLIPLRSIWNFVQVPMSILLEGTVRFDKTTSSCTFSTLELSVIVHVCISKASHFP